jgi:cardiolipin synthase
LRNRILSSEYHVYACGNNNRSFRLNFEITDLIVDRECNEEVEQMFADDFQHSSIMERGAYSTKPFWFKLAVRLANLTSPML